MKNRSTVSLVVLNAVLVVVLATITLVPMATAQAPATARSTGRYVLLSGTVQNVYPGVVYIVDDTNQEIVAVQYNETTKSFLGMGFRDIKSDISTFQNNR